MSSVVTPSTCPAPRTVIWGAGPAVPKSRGLNVIVGALGLGVSGGPDACADSRVGDGWPAMHPESMTRRRQGHGASSSWRGTLPPLKKFNNME